MKKKNFAIESENVLKDKRFFSKKNVVFAKTKIAVVAVMILCLAFCAFGCERQVASANVTRDDAHTGGTLSFVYDSQNRTVTIGGEGEVVQWSSENEALGLCAGCRVGLKFTAPDDEELEIEYATMQMNGVTYSAGDFLETVNGVKQRYFNIYPVFSEKDNSVTVTVKWDDTAKEQEYKIQIAEGTTFMTQQDE